MTREALLSHLTNAAGGSAVDERTQLFSSGLLDSFDLAELLAFVEAFASRRIRPSDVSLENFDSVERILLFASR